MSLMSPTMYYSCLFYELSLMEEFRNKISIESRCVLLSEQSLIFPDYSVRMKYFIVIFGVSVNVYLLVFC